MRWIREVLRDLVRISICCSRQSGSSAITWIQMTTQSRQINAAVLRPPTAADPSEVERRLDYYKMNTPHLPRKIPSWFAYFAVAAPLSEFNRFSYTPIFYVSLESNFEAAFLDTLESFVIERLE